MRGKAPKRVLQLLQHPKGTTGPSQPSQLVIRETDNNYSEQMQALTRNFYLFMT